MIGSYGKNKLVLLSDNKESQQYIKISSCTRMFVHIYIYTHICGCTCSI